MLMVVNMMLQASLLFMLVMSKPLHQVVLCEALHIPVHNLYYIFIWHDIIRCFMTSISYDEIMARLGQLKRPCLKMEWDFYFKCITRAFTNICTDFDVITQISQQIGCSLIHGFHYNFGRNILSFITERMIENRTKVYYARFVQLIFNHLSPNIEIPDTDEIQLFKLNKRSVSDLVSKDRKKDHVRSSRIPAQVDIFFFIVFLLCMYLIQ